MPNTEYDAALAQAQDIIDDQGAFATVSREVNGELETRALRDEIEDLDVLEDMGSIDSKPVRELVEENPRRRQGGVSRCAAPSTGSEA